MHLFWLNNSITAICQAELHSYSGDLRLVIVGILGSSITTISLFENLILFYVFATSRKLRRQNYANPVLLAFFDALVSFSYFFIESTHFFAFRLKLIHLAIFWAKYMRIAYCIQHFALTVSNFLLVVASIERYLANGPHHLQKRILVMIVHHKPLVIAFVLFLAFLFKATILFENDVLHLPNCPAIISFVPIWKQSNALSQLRFWLRKAFTIILPFFVLAYCNFNIVLHLRNRRRHFYKINSIISSNKKDVETDHTQEKTYHAHVLMPLKKNAETIPKWRTTQKTDKKNPVIQTDNTEALSIALDLEENSSKWDNSPTTITKSSHNYSPKYSPHGAQKTLLRTENNQKNEKQGVRIATRTLAMVVGCYLISNSMTTIINIWEDIDQNFLRYQHFDTYFVMSDIAVLLTICGCALRLPIYVSNDRRIRNAIIRALIRFRYCYRRNLKNLAVDANFDCDKWSIIIVSNSLKSNITGLLSQMDINTFKEKKSFDQLAVLVQNRRRFLVQMTINLGTVEELTEERESTIHIGENDEPTFFTDLQDGDLCAPINNMQISTSINQSQLHLPTTQKAKNNHEKNNIHGNIRLQEVGESPTERDHSTVIVRKRT